VFAGGGTGRNGGAADDAVGELDVDFNGRIAAGIDDFAGGDGTDRGIAHVERKGAVKRTARGREAETLRTGCLWLRAGRTTFE
jgi:hypothetical protein